MPTDIERALGYPYEIPEQSYLLGVTGPRPLVTDEPAPDLAGRHGVIACGSNQSPEQLARKFDVGHFGSDNGSPIPVLRTRVDGFDSVYSPHFSAYGAIAATLHHHPGVSVDLFTTWLTDDQLTRMHETEALGLNYDYARMDSVRIDIDGIDGIDQSKSIFAYIGRRGSLSLDGQPIALSTVTAKGRQGPSMSQEQVQCLARDRLADGVDLHQFISENITDKTVRRERTRRLAEGSLPFSYPDHQCLEVTVQ